jgi:hypothetical protein
VPQDRLRKYSEENIELSRNLRKDMDAQRRAAAKPMTTTATATRKRDFNASSARGSEERTANVAALPRGTKRGREFEGIDKVSICFLSRVWILIEILLPRFAPRHMPPGCLHHKTPVQTKRIRFNVYLRCNHSLSRSNKKVFEPSTNKQAGGRISSSAFNQNLHARQSQSHPRR